MAGLRRCGLVLAVVAAASGCGDDGPARPPPSATPAIAPRPQVEVTWGSEATVYDVLGREQASDPAPRSVEVPRRRPSAAGVFPIPPGEGWAAPYRRATQCGPGFCVDGLRTASVEILEAEPTADERDVLAAGASDSWVERGIRVLAAGPGYVSLYIGHASFTAGAAHSVADVECRTFEPGVRPIRPATLTAVFGAAEAQALTEAVRSFLEEQREVDLRAEGLRPPADLDFLLAASNTPLPEHDPVVSFCLSRDVENDAGYVQLVRAVLRRR